jgi:DNA-binding NtrC family response regulator
MPRDRIVIVEDDEYMREGLQETLAGIGATLSAYGRAEDAVDELADGSASLLLTDMRLPGMDGMALLEQARRLDPKLPVVMMTAFATVETAVQAMKQGAFDYVMKPFNGDEILVVVDRALRHRRLVAENEFLKSELADRFRLEDFVGESPAMQTALEEIRQVAPAGSTVFIRGESGTGKELAARAIHAQSPRRERPLVRVNCAALSAGVLESELFGHERGAFTGADRRRIGRFEIADGGTLFLDEVSEMDLGLQGKLLRVLQEKEFERVGSSETIRVDVRILASSNRDLEEEIAAGTFRQDLYYRLNVVSVELPPLRERAGDIRPLVRHFIGKLNRENGTRVEGVSDEAFAILESYDWPGNVRELENIVERAVVLHPGETIEARHISGSLERAPGRAVAGGESGADFTPRALEEIEREHVLRVLGYHEGHRLKSARTLGISERSLRDRLKRWKDAGLVGEDV